MKKRKSTKKKNKKLGGSLAGFLGKKHKKTTLGELLKNLRDKTDRF